MLWLRTGYFCLGFCLLSWATLFAQKLSDASPESVGLSSAGFERLDAFLQEYIDQKRMPGAVALVARKGKIIYHKAFGQSAPYKAMQKNHLFRIASMTKPITSVAVMMLYEEGKLRLEDPISQYIPEFKNPQVLKTLHAADTSYTTEPARREITIHDLLTHTSGISYGFVDSLRANALYTKAQIPDLATMHPLTIGQVVKKLATLPLMHHPGEAWTYGLNTDVLGYLVEVVSGMSLADFFQNRIFEPLGMQDTRFFYPDSVATRLVAMSYEGKAGTVDFYKDEPLAQLADYPVKGAKTYYSGGSGLCSTAEDYAKFCQMIANGGKYGGKQLLKTNTLLRLATPQNPRLAERAPLFGLGFGLKTAPGVEKQKNTAWPVAYNLSWGGAFHTTFWIDPTHELIAVLMTQVYPTRQEAFFSRFEKLVYETFPE